MQGLFVLPRIPPTPFCNPSATLLQPNVASRNGAQQHSLALRGTPAPRLAGFLRAVASVLSLLRLGAARWFWRVETDATDETEGSGGEPGDRPCPACVSRVHGAVMAKRDEASYTWRVYTRDRRVHVRLVV